MILSSQHRPFQLGAGEVSEEKNTWASRKTEMMTRWVKRVKSVFIVFMSLKSTPIAILEIFHTCNIVRLNGDSQSLKQHVHYTTLLENAGNNVDWLSKSVVQDVVPPAPDAPDIARERRLDTDDVISYMRCSRVSGFSSLEWSATDDCCYGKRWIPWCRTIYFVRALYHRQWRYINETDIFSRRRRRQKYYGYI